MHPRGSTEEITLSRHDASQEAGKGPRTVEQRETAREVRAFLRVNQCLFLWSLVPIIAFLKWNDILEDAPELVTRLTVEQLGFIWAGAIILGFWFSFSSLRVLKDRELGAKLWVILLGILSLGFVPLLQLRWRLRARLRKRGLRTGLFGSSKPKAFPTVIPSRGDSQSPAHEAWAQHYDEVYARGYGQAYERLTQATLDLVDGHGNNLRILDYGAGTGRLSLPLSRDGHKVTAVEPSPAMLAQLAAKDSGNLVARSGGSMATHEAEEYHNLALAVFSVISYVTEWEQLRDAFAKARLQLRENGRLIIDLPNPIAFRDFDLERDGLRRSVRFVATGENRFEYREHTELTKEGRTVTFTENLPLRMWTETEVVKALREAGFSTVRHLREGDFTSVEHMNALKQSGADYFICINPVEGVIPDEGSIWEHGRVIMKWVGIAAIFAMIASGNSRKRKQEAAKEREVMLANALASGDSKNLVELGSLFSNDEDDKDAPERAFQCWSEAAKLGNPRAQIVTAHLFLTGKGVRKDINAAIRGAEAQGRAGQPYALWVLGLAHLERHRDTDSADDLMTALDALNRGARQGDPWCISSLASIHAKGQGVPKNLVEAYKWLVVMQNLDPHKKSAFDFTIKRTLEAELSTDQKAEAKRQAAEFLAKYPEKK